MNGSKFNHRSDAVARRRDGPGLGDDIACVKCGAVALDTGLECSECGLDNYEAVTGEPFKGGRTNADAAKASAQHGASDNSGQDQPSRCEFADDPRGCYRVRCQLGKKCVGEKEEKDHP